MLEEKKFFLKRFNKEQQSNILILHYLSNHLKAERRFQTHNTSMCINHENQYVVFLAYQKNTEC